MEILESLEVVPLDAARPARLRATRAGCRSRSAATTPARSASCRRCAARSRTAGRATSWPRSQALVAEGVLEVTLLGQNVNSYGVEFGDRFAFGKLLRACGEIDGLERVRFTSPHPKDFTDDVIAAMAETPNVCHQLHMPLQSGSDRVLRAMRRSYRRAALPGDHRRGARRDAGRGDHHRHHRRLPRRDRGGLRGRRWTWCAAARFAGGVHLPVLQAPRHAGRGDGRTSCPRRSCRSGSSGWSRCRTRSSWAANQELVGRTVEVLVATGEGRKDAATHRMSGRARDGRLVHFAPAADGVRPGDVVTTTITYGAPHHLVADGALVGTAAPGRVTTTRQGIRPKTSGVGLGLPAFGARPRPTSEPVAADARPMTTADPRLDGLREEIDEVERTTVRTVDLGVRGDDHRRRRVRAADRRRSCRGWAARPAWTCCSVSRTDRQGEHGPSAVRRDLSRVRRGGVGARPDDPPLGLTWVCALGGWFATVNGILAIWSRQSCVTPAPAPAW